MPGTVVTDMDDPDTPPRGYLLLHGWPGSGKSTLGGRLSAELGVPLLAKDPIKRALERSLGAPRDLDESRRLGRAAVLAVLASARGCPGAVLDSTWFPYALPAVRDLPGPRVEVRCAIDPSLARERWRARTDADPAPLDPQRSDQELWGQPVTQLGVGPVLAVDTSGDVDVVAVARRARRLLAADSGRQPTVH